MIPCKHHQKSIRVIKVRSQYYRNLIEKENYNEEYLTIILNAPSGVTRTAGAKAYATKFAISPTITEQDTIQKQILQVIR
jgi:hypothetical protein